MAASAEIQRFDRNRDGFVEYFIKVVYNGRQWSVKKRYKEFDVLNEFLLKEGISPPQPLPPKFPWRRHDDKMLKLRRKELQVFLDGLLGATPINNNRLLREFLEVDVGLLGFSRKMPKLLYMLDKISNAPEEFSSSLIAFVARRAVELSPSSMPKTPRSFPSMPFLRKSKSLSFSTRSPSKASIRESFATEAANTSGRRMSIDYFSISNSVSAATAADEKRLSSKKSTFIRATNGVWSHYEDELLSRGRRTDRAALCEEAEASSSYGELLAAVEGAVLPFVENPSVLVDYKYCLSAAVLRFSQIKSP